MLLYVFDAFFVLSEEIGKEKIRQQAEVREKRWRWHIAAGKYHRGKP
jgi:hypothetical protein